jgi:hypothetical protein
MKSAIKEGSYSMASMCRIKRGSTKGGTVQAEPMRFGNAMAESLLHINMEKVWTR